MIKWGEKMRKKIAEKIIVALDVPTVKQALNIVEELKKFPVLYKIGHRLLGYVLGELVASPYEKAEELLRQLRILFHETYGRLFLDLKFLDIPSVIEEAIRKYERTGIKIISVSCFGGEESLKKVKEVIDSYDNLFPKPEIFGVAFLSSTEYADLVRLGREEFNIANPVEKAYLESKEIEGILKNIASWLIDDLELDGMVCPANFVSALRRHVGDNLKLAAVGITTPWSKDAQWDQKQHASLKKVLEGNPDYLILGRSIISPPPEIGSPRDALERIIEEIERV